MPRASSSVALEAPSREDLVRAAAGTVCAFWWRGRQEPSNSCGRFPIAADPPRMYNTYTVQIPTHLYLPILLKISISPAQAGGCRSGSAGDRTEVPGPAPQSEKLTQYSVDGGHAICICCLRFCMECSVVVVSPVVGSAETVAGGGQHQFPLPRNPAGHGGLFVTGPH